MQRILLIDNYDSFTYNLAHYFENLGAQVQVVRNDEFSGDLSSYDKVVLSPGPGLPREAGRLMDIIQMADGKVPLLGVCLGMQGVAEYLGAELYNMDRVRHGVEARVNLASGALFDEISEEMIVGLYHSWAVKEGQGDFVVVGRSEDGTVMAIENVERKLYGVQFHPESVMTPDGKKVVANFLNNI